jgi:hypothetical protein
MSTTKTLRFEVFKRDGFTCQYCGSKPPDVTLEADHIVPVSDGGTDEIDNLITACFSCNRGKGARQLTSMPRAIINRSDDMEEREAQLRAYNRLQDQRKRRILRDVEAVNKRYSELENNEYELSEKGKSDVRFLLEKFAKADIIEALEIAYAKRVSGDRFRYACGVLWNWRKNGRA